MKKLYLYCGRFITACTLVFVFLSFLFSTDFVNKRSLILSGSPNITMLIQSALAFVLLGAAFFIFKIINNLNEKGQKVLTIGLFAVFLAVGITVCLSYTVVQTTDSYRCIDTAISFLTDKKPIDENFPYFWYFKDFSNNNFFVLLLTIFFKICSFFGINNFISAAEWLNLALIFTSVILAFLSAKLIGGRKFAVKTLFLIVINPTLYLFTQWIYTCTFSLPIMMGIFYLFMLAKKCDKLTKRIAFSVGIGLLSAIGYLLRPTAIFPLLAAIAICVVSFRFKKEYFIKYGACLLAFLVVFSVAYIPIKTASNKPFEKTLEYNLPLTHWVLLGLSDYGMVNKKDIKITRSGITKEGMKKADINEIKKRLKKHNLYTLARHQAKKLNNTWTDGTNNYFLRVRQIINENQITNILTGEKSMFFTLYAQAFRIFSFLSLIIALILLLYKKNLKNFGLFASIITLFGGYLFYMIWETKQDYSLPFTLFLLIIASFGINKLAENLKITKPVFKKSRFVRLDSILAVCCVACILVSAFGFVRLYNDSVIKKNESLDYSIKIASRKFIEPINYIPTREKPIEQTFFTKKPFNNIAVFSTKTRHNNNYTIELYNKDNKLIKSGKIARNKDKLCNLSFDRQIPENEQEYKLKIFADSNEKPIRFFKTVSCGLDSYKGNLIYQNQSEKGDLFLQVYNKEISPVFSKSFYLSACFIILLFETAVSLGFVLSFVKIKS